MENPLKVLRERLNLDVEQLARALETSPYTIEDIEKGRMSSIPEHLALKIESVYGVPKEQLHRDYQAWMQTKPQEDSTQSVSISEGEPSILEMLATKSVPALKKIFAFAIAHPVSAVIAVIVLWFLLTGEPGTLVQQPEQKAEQTTQLVYPVGTLVQVGEDFKFGTRWDKTLILSAVGDELPSPGFVYILVPVAVQNNTAKTESLGLSLDWYLVDTYTGYKYESVDGIEYELREDLRIGWSKPIQPYQIKEGYKIFEVPSGATGDKFQLEIEVGILSVKRARFEIPTPTKLK